MTLFFGLAMLFVCAILLAIISSSCFYGYINFKVLIGQDSFCICKKVLHHRHSNGTLPEVFNLTLNLAEHCGQAVIVKFFLFVSKSCLKRPSYGLVAFTELDTLMVARVGAIVSFLGENSSSLRSLKRLAVNAEKLTDLFASIKP